MPHLSQLTHLRCRTDGGSCQHAESPTRLLLAVDFEDGSGTFGQGALDLRVDGRTQNAVSLADVFQLQGIAANATKGTLNIDDDVVLSAIKDGSTAKVSLLATDGQGKDSNEPSITFVVHTGGSP